MRVLWIIYNTLGNAARLLTGTTSQSGTWIDATTDNLLGMNENVNLAVAAIDSKSMKMIDPDSGVVYYGVSGVKRCRGKRDSETAKKKWGAVLEDFKPDIIQIWGTDFSNGLDVAEVSRGIPAVVYIQGVIRAIDKYKNGGLPFSELRHHINILDKIKCMKLVMNQRNLHKQVAYEEQLVNRVQNIIIDSDWCESQYKSFCRDLKPYRLSFSVNQAFLKERWDLKYSRKNTIFCIAGRTPYKGLYQAIKALAIVRRQIPDARLIIPGDMTPQGSVLLTRSPYLVYLDKLIETEGLKDNIDFIGRLNVEQMIQRMLSANVFVNPSCIENSPSSLREAMYLGMPCISSFAGSIYEFMAHNITGLLYRFEEFDDLAFHIMKVLTQSDFAVKIGNNAYDSIREKHPQTHLGKDLYRIYENILKNDKSES